MSVYSDLLLSLTPSLYWPLDAVNGATDQSGNGRNGTASGPTIGGETIIVPPIVGASASCTDLDGTDDKVTSTYSPFTNATTRSFCGWAYRDVNSAIHMLFAGGGTASTTVALWLASGSNDMVFRSDFSGASVTWTGAWTGTTTWVMWALVFNETANTAALYINGSLVSSQTQSVAYNAAVGSFQVGARGLSSTNPWNGKQGHVATFEYGLTATNISDLWVASTTAALVPTIPDIVSAPALA